MPKGGDHTRPPLPVRLLAMSPFWNTYCMPPTISFLRAALLNFLRGVVHGSQEAYLEVLEGVVSAKRAKDVVCERSLRRGPRRAQEFVPIAVCERPGFA